MNSPDSPELIAKDVLTGRISRRALLKRAAALGLTAPVVASLLAACDNGDEAEGESPDEPVVDVEIDEVDEPAGEQLDDQEPEPDDVVDEPEDEAVDELDDDENDVVPEPENDRHLTLLWWQPVDTINPHLAQGTKDSDAASVVYEALAYVGDHGQLIPRLAASIPSVADGTVDEGGMWVEWSLRDDVIWHDGEQFTADDVRFTWEYITDEATRATTFATYQDVEDVEIIDDFTLRVHFREPTPGWFVPFTGVNGLIIPEHRFREFVGEAAHESPLNLEPVGTGPFRAVEFRPANRVSFERNEQYWDAGKPYFDTVEMRGGGDITEIARAVLVTGEADWAWNIQIEPDVIQTLDDQGAEGFVLTWPGVSTERLMINFADPWTEVDGARSEPENPHPFLSDRRIRDALRRSIQRDVIADELYGPGGVVTANNLNQPEWAVNQDLFWEFDLDQAASLLDEAGAVDTDGDGVREYNGSPLSMLFQTTENPIRQLTQEIIRDALQSIGFDVELKAVNSAVFFSGDPENTDSYSHFYADIQMYANGPNSPYPADWTHRFASWEIAERLNDWTGVNSSRYANETMDSLIMAMGTAMEPEEQEYLFQEMNRISVEDGVEIPIVHRTGVAAVSNNLAGYQPGPWVSDLWDIGNWYREDENGPGAG